MVSVKQADGECWLLYSPYMQEEGQFLVRPKIKNFATSS